MNIFTHLNEKREKEIIDFLNQEIEDVNTYMIQNSKKLHNNYLMDFEKALFHFSIQDRDETIILN